VAYYGALLWYSWLQADKTRLNIFIRLAALQYFCGCVPLF
jgi:hypothetical protein